MPLTCPALSAQTGIRHGFFTRRGGHSTGHYHALNCGYGSGDDIATVAKNRHIVAEQFGIGADALCTAYQIHSPSVVTLEKPWAWKDAPQADAMATNTPGIALGILTADCVPILFSDPDARVIGAAHAGWKGAFTGVIEATLEAMQKLGAAPATTTATLGPAIDQASYEVGAEFRERFTQQDPGHVQYFVPGARAGHYMFDLKAYVKDRLRQCGLGQINMLAHDTCLEEDDFFSFRRATLRGEPVYGRLISTIMLTPT
jgi:polyphenol oxidase